ncbi:MAG: hypothetical protein ACTHMG_06465 [Sphingomonas sp.]
MTDRLDFPARSRSRPKTAVDRNWPQILARAEEAWLMPLAVGAAWWNAAVSFWFGAAEWRRTRHFADQLPVPDLLERHGEHALFA